MNLGEEQITAYERLTAQIRERRDALIEQLERGRAQYDALEARLQLLGRNLDAMSGGIQELEALLAAVEPPPPPEDT